MGRYTNNYCAVCFNELIRPQNTCGAPECLAEWRLWSAAKRFSRKNLAHMPPSERALVLAQGPSSVDLEEAAARQAQLDDELRQFAAKKQQAQTPQFLRDALSPTNAPIRKEVTSDEADDSSPRARHDGSEV